MTLNTIVGHVVKVFVMVALPRPALSQSGAGDPHLCEYVTAAMTAGVFN